MSVPLNKLNWKKSTMDLGTYCNMLTNQNKATAACFTRLGDSEGRTGKQ